MVHLLVSLFAILAVILGIAWKVAIPTFIVFLVLKLCNVIAWSWVYVFIPLIVLAGSLIISIILSVLFELDEN